MEFQDNSHWGNDKMFWVQEGVDLALCYMDAYTEKMLQ